MFHNKRKNEQKQKRTMGRRKGAFSFVGFFQTEKVGLMGRNGAQWGSIGRVFSNETFDLLGLVWGFVLVDVKEGNLKRKKIQNFIAFPNRATLLSNKGARSAILSPPNLPSVYGPRLGGLIYSIKE